MSAEREEGRAGTPEDWLQIARSDLNLARIARSAEGVLPEQVAFHAQQCAEKSLKSVKDLYFYG